MSILSVDTIQPIGSGSTVTLNAAKTAVGTGITFESNGQAIYAGIITATSFSGTASNASGATGDFSIADKIVHTGDTNTAIRFPVGDVISAETNGAERLRITSAGTLLLGTSTGALANGNGIVIADATAARLSLKDTTNGVTGTDGFDVVQTGTDAFLYHRENGNMIFGTNATERLRIDSSGRVMIGTSTEGAGAADRLTIASSATAGMTIRSGTSNQGNIYFSDGTSGLDEYRGIVRYDHSDNSMSFRTDATERLRITSDGSTQIASGVLQRRYESTNTAGYRYYSKADRFQIAHGGSGTNLTITGMNQGWASIRFGGYTEGQRVNFRADIAGYNAGNAGVRLYDSNEITNQATSYSSGSCNITVTKNNASYVVNVTQSNPQGNSMASFYYFETGGYNSVSTLTIS